MAELAFLDVRTRAKWHAWLGKHHTSSRGVWVVVHKAHTGVKSMAYEDFVREALCFGWIDSLVKRLDDDRFAIKVTPRKANAEAWSFFQTLPRRERRNFVVWIHIAKRPETRQRRIRESVALLAAGKKLGLK